MNVYRSKREEGETMATEDKRFDAVSFSAFRGKQKNKIVRSVNL